MSDINPPVNATDEEFYDWAKKNTDNLEAEKKYYDNLDYYLYDDDIDSIRKIDKNNDWSDYGNSIHDSPGLNPEYKNGELNEVRAADQGFFEKVGLGAAKYTTTAASTFLSGTIGILYGIPKSISEGNASYLYDNDFTNAMQDFNEWAEKKMPHYSSHYEGWGADFWGNFIGKDILQNLGFQTGTALTMMVPGGALGALSKIGRLGKLANTLGKISKAMKNIAPAAKELIMSTYGSIGESSLEALQNKRDFVEYQSKVNEDEFKEQNEMLDSQWRDIVRESYNGDIREAEKSQDYLNYVQKKNELIEQKNNKDRFIQQEAEKVGDMTFMANMAIVGLSNYVTFGKAVTGGFGLFKRSNTITDIVDKETGEVLKKNVSKSTAKDVIREGKFAVKDKETGDKIFKNAITQERGRTKSPLLNTIKDMFSEGLEEMNQSVASEMYSGKAEEDMLNYDALTRDGMAYDDVVNCMNNSWNSLGNIARALKKVYTDPSQWRQFFSGMIGAGFSPHFQKGSDGKVHFKLNNIGEQNAEINAYNSANALIAEDINRILNSEESQNYINGLVRHNALDNAKSGSVALDSKMDFNDADFAQFISDISMLSDAGKLDLYRTQLENIKTLTDEELEDYCTKLCNDVNGKKVGEFVDANGNYIGNSDSARYDIRKKINNRVDRLLKDMNTYQKSINDIDNETGGVLNRKDLAVFAWEKANVVNKYTRAKSILASEASANNLKAAKEKMSLNVKNMTSQLDVVKNTLDKEKERIQKANSLNAAAESTKKIDKSDFQKELEDGIDTLTSNINIATEISQLIADLEIMQTELGDNASEMDAVKDLFNKYKDFRESMPETAKAMGLTDEKGMSLEYLMKSRQLGKLLKSEDNEIDSEWSDAAILYGKGEIIGESLEDLIKNPERYSTGRAEMEQKILERENADTIKAIEDEIKKAIDDGSMNFGNIEERTNEIIDNLKNAKNEKNVGRRLFRNAVNMLRNTPFDALRKIALENVLNSKKYQYLRDFSKFVNYVNLRIAMSQADPDAIMIAQKTFTEFIEDKKTVEECLEAKIKLEDIDVSELYKDNYTPETYANAQLVQNEVFKMFETIFKDFAMDYYSPKLNIDKYDSGNILPNSEAVKANEVRKQIDKVKNKLTKYVNDFSGDILSAEDQENIFKHIDSVIEEEFGETNYEDPTNLELDSAKLELKTFMHKYLLDNANKRLTNLYDNKANDIEELKRNKEIIAKAKAKINKTIDSIGKNLKDDNTFNTDFDKLSEQDESIEVRDSKEGYYVEGDKVMRGYMAPCQVRLPGEESADIRYALVFQANSNSRYWIYIIGNDGQRIGSLLVDKSEIDLNNLDFTNVEGVINLHDRLSLTDFATIKLLEKENQILNDQQYRLQNLREQASAEVLQSNGTVDENGKVDVSQNLHNSTVTVNALMDDNITRSKSDIETIVESSRPASEQRLTIEYYAVYDYDNDQILRVQLPTNGKRIKIKEENGKTKEVKFSQSQYKKEGINGILKSIYSDNIEILQSSQEEWTGKKAEPKTQKKVEPKPVVEIKNESNEKDDFDYTTIFNLNDIDGSKVEVETISKPWKKDPSKKNRSLNIYLKGEKDKGYYQLVKDHEDGFYSVHFKTNNGQHTKTDVKPSTKEERAILYQQLINAIPEGGKVSTWGEISKGGIIALNKVGKDMKNVGTRTISLDDEAHTPVDIPIFEKTPIQKQPAKPTETPQQKAKKEAKQKAKNTASELSKQLAKLEQMEKELEEAVKNNPDSDYADTLHSVRTFKNYVQLVRDNYEEMGRPEKIVIDANAIWSINHKLTENLKAIFGNDNVLVLSDEEINKNLTGNEQFSANNKTKNNALNNKNTNNDDTDRNNEETSERRNERGDFGLLDEVKNIIKRGNDTSRETERERIQDEEYIRLRNSEDESALEKLAKEQGKWLEDADTTLEERYGEYIGHGAESFVYLKDKNTVVKSRTIDTNVGGGYSTYQEAIESIAIHNELFPETAMKIVGFGRSDGEFCVIIEQSKIDGRYATTEEISKFVADKFGAVKDDSVLGGQSYKNSKYLLQDLKPKNVIVKSVNGKERLFVIDGDFYKNPNQQHSDIQFSRQLSETETIKQKAIADGTFMKAPNGKATNLTEQQWLQVRTKAFKDWFGDWENDPENASKVVDENGEPLVVYHGTTNATFNEFAEDVVIYTTPDIEVAATYLEDSNSISYKDNSLDDDYNEHDALRDIQFITDDLEYSIIAIKEGWKGTENIENFLAKNGLKKEALNINSINELRDFAVKIKNDYFDEFKKAVNLDDIAKNTYKLFDNIKNPLIIDANYNEWNKIPFENDITSTRALENIARNRGYDGVIIKNVSDLGAGATNEQRFNGTYGTVIFTYDTNNVKSATENNGEFSKENDNIYLSKQNGEVFGYTADGKIVINKDRIRLDTPVHEYTHLWDQAVQRINPEFWNQGKELMKQSAEWQKVINDPAYESIKDNEDLVASEVHSRLAGYIAAGKSVELYAKDRTKDKRNWFKRLIDWFMKFKDFTLKNIFNMSKADCKEIKLEQFLNAPVADFFMQTDPRKIGKEEIVVQEEAKPIEKPATAEESAPAESVSDEQTIEEPVSEPEATTDTTDVYPIADTIEDKTKELDEQIPALPLNVENQEEREVFATIDAINEHNDPPVPLDTYRPAISRFPIGKNNDTRPSYVVLGNGFEYIWNMYNALGAWDYVSQGKLSKDDDVYVGYGKVGENGKTVYEDVVFFVKDGDEYQMIGTLANKNAPESANKLRNDIKRRYESGKQDMEKITVMAQKASGQFQSGKEFEFHLVKNGDKFLTTKPSKILNGRMQFTDTEYRSLKDVETPDGSKDFNIGFFTPDGLRDNMTTTDENKAKQFRSASSERSGHCVLILNKPDGDYQLVPLRLAKFSEINKPNNQVANDFRNIVSDLFDIYKSDKSAVMKNNEIVDSIANGGIIARMSNLVHTGEFSLFYNTNNTITVSVNGKKYKNQRFDSVEKMQDFFEDIMKDCLICVNKNTLNNPETLSKYVESDVFSTNLKTTEFANPFYTLMPIDSNGKELDVVNDIQDDNYLGENDITTVLSKFGDRTYAVIDKFGNVKIGVKQFDEFNTSEANRLYSPEQRMRMISYALLKNGMQSNPNDSLFDDYHIDDDENETTLLAHKTMYGDTIFYEVENFTEISPDRVSYYDGEGNLIKLSKPEETETVDNDDSDAETYEDDDYYDYLEVDLDDEDDVIEIDDEEDIVLDEEDLDDEEIDNEDNDISEESIEVDNESEDKFQEDVNTLMNKDLAKGFWKAFETLKEEFENSPMLFVLTLDNNLNEPNVRKDLRMYGNDEIVDTIENFMERYRENAITDYLRLFMDSNSNNFEDGFKLVSEEAVRKILKNNLLNKEDDPSKLANKKNDECQF